MLVSSIVRFNAVQSMNNAAFGVMQTYNQMNNALSHHTFGGENNLTMLHEMDKKLSLDLVSNSLLYKIASLQEKMAQKHQTQDIEKGRLSILA